MGIKPNFTAADIKKEIKRKLGLLDDAIFRLFHYVGESFVANARTNGTYIDRTGNLRQSIGYIIYKDGSKRAISFPGAVPDGLKAARDAFNEIPSADRKGYILIVVAGMNYAAAVESKGYDVLTNSSDRAESMLKQQLESLLRNFQA
ncbi:hypothetical protein [Hufsiella ginkgonis]|uniref:HK97 gp10 family phage protein n=1 Tax=Hufsiella ginkgonis TaxID=2695274 RepID=A0A7K1Y0R4_9SPHI|nr:hypothetical protein [Hufsiella ginkgonis]MXV16833.1 hypothetical protein [Hufsiella ginkgonis]